ncbi:MAG: thiamine-phosphate kinase [Bacteroidales bacterium]|nr:thiamine-phosphate kinase [Bacteroidales bacterium]MCF8390658.1 thiamine-phosphate kinase [Bacteroidales bacterium]
MAKAKTPVSLSELGEFGLIEKLTKDISLKHKTSLKGVGDDAAVIDCGETCRVITTDMLTEGIHFNLMYVPLKHLGYKAVMVNLSDVYAMNAIPKQITVSISVSSKFSVEAIEELYAGIHLACETYDVDLIGGDTVSSLTGLTISVTAIGEARKEDVKYRSGAQLNDLICVSGDLGAAYLGLQILEREKDIYEKDNSIQPHLDGYDYILERQLKPEARKDIIEWFKAEGIKVNALIDISDGLSSELVHICKASDKGCQIYPEKIPINQSATDVAKELELEDLVAALHGGEDYELLFTVPISEYDKVNNFDGVSIIGNITDSGKAVLVTAEGEGVELVAQGWDGF